MTCARSTRRTSVVEDVGEEGGGQFPVVAKVPEDVAAHACERSRLCAVSQAFTPGRRSARHPRKVVCASSEQKLSPSAAWSGRSMLPYGVVDR